MDREKVIKGLECCIRHGENAEVGCGRKDECPYEQNGLKCWLDLNRDALAMLKEQEAVEPKVEKAILDYQSWHYICGDCGGQIDIHDNYCRHCGRVVAHLSNKI